MDEGLVLVVEGAEAGDGAGGVGAEDFGEGFDDAHEDVLAGDRGGLVPEVDCEIGVGDDVTTIGGRAGGGGSALFLGVFHGGRWWRLTH